MRLTYPSTAKVEAPTDLEGAAKAAYALDQKASSVLLALEAQSERNEATEQLCRSVKEAVARTDYDSAISFSRKVDGLEETSNWLEDELEGEANGRSSRFVKGQPRSPRRGRRSERAVPRERAL